MNRLRIGPDFDGETYDPVQDKYRLTGQLLSVYLFMRDGNWHTLREMSDNIKGSEAALSARLRDLRKEKFGGFEVQRKRGFGTGTFFYRLIIGQQELF